jgi:hypothetical protein
VAVKLTCWLTAEALGEETRVVVVVVAPTVCGAVPELVTKLASPEYAAEIT